MPIEETIREVTLKLGLEVSSTNAADQVSEIQQATDSFLAVLEGQVSGVTELVGDTVDSVVEIADQASGLENVAAAASTIQEELADAVEPAGDVVEALQGLKPVAEDIEALNFESLLDQLEELHGANVTLEEFGDGINTASDIASAASVSIGDVAGVASTTASAVNQLATSFAATTGISSELTDTVSLVTDGLSAGAEVIDQASTVTEGLSRVSQVLSTVTGTEAAVTNVASAAHTANAAAKTASASASTALTLATGPVGATIAVVGAALLVATKLWQEYGISAEENAEAGLESLELIIGAHDRAAEAARQQRDANKDLFDVLQEGRFLLAGGDDERRQIRLDAIPEREQARNTEAAQIAGPLSDAIASALVRTSRDNQDAREGVFIANQLKEVLQGDVASDGFVGLEELLRNLQREQREALGDIRQARESGDDQGLTEALKAADTIANVVNTIGTLFEDETRSDRTDLRFLQGERERIDREGDSLRDARNRESAEFSEQREAIESAIDSGFTAAIRAGTATPESVAALDRDLFSREGLDRFEAAKPEDLASNRDFADALEAAQFDQLQDQEEVRQIDDKLERIQRERSKVTVQLDEMEAQVSQLLPAFEGINRRLADLLLLESQRQSRGQVK